MLIGTVDYLLLKHEPRFSHYRALFSALTNASDELLRHPIATPQPLASTCSEDEPGPSQAHRCEGYAALGLANGQVVLRVHRGLTAAPGSRGYCGAACQLRTRPPRERARAPPAPVP